MVEWTQEVGRENGRGIYTRIRKEKTRETGFEVNLRAKAMQRKESKIYKQVRSRKVKSNRKGNVPGVVEPGATVQV